MFCLYTSGKLSHPLFEFSLKVKVMGSNPGYFLKSFLLYNKKHYKKAFKKEYCKKGSFSDSTGTGAFKAVEIVFDCEFRLAVHVGIANSSDWQHKYRQN